MLIFNFQMYFIGYNYPIHMTFLYNGADNNKVQYYKQGISIIKSLLYLINFVTNLCTVLFRLTN